MSYTSQTRYRLRVSGHRQAGRRTPYQLNAELPKLEAEVDFMRVNKLSADDVMHEANAMYDQWPSLASEDKRKIMEALVEKVTIGNGEIDITFSCMPSSEDVFKNQQMLGPG